MKNAMYLWMVMLLVSATAGATVKTEANYNEDQNLTIGPVDAPWDGVLLEGTTVSGSNLNVPIDFGGVIYGGPNGNANKYFNIVDYGDTDNRTWGQNTMVAIVKPNWSSEKTAAIACVGGGPYDSDPVYKGMVFYFSSEAGGSYMDFVRLDLSRDWVTQSWYIRNYESWFDPNATYFCAASWSDLGTQIDCKLYIRKLSDTTGTNALFGGWTTDWTAEPSSWNSQSVYVGMRYNITTGGDYAFDGSIDIFQIYDNYTGTKADFEALFSNLVRTSVSGTVTLDNYPGDRSEVAVTVDLKQSGSSVHKETVLLGSDGSFVTTWPIPAGTYDIYVKGCVWQQKAFLSQTVISEPIDLGAFNLASGDADGSNQITSTDLLIILNNIDQQGDQ
ncbi:MAG: hypothetical protein WC975_12110 [Phycisphaerae bacterium]